MVLFAREIIRKVWNHESVKQCTNFISLCAAFVCMILLLLSLLAITFHSNAVQVNIVYIELDSNIVANNGEMFLSIGLDSSVIADNFKNFDMNNPYLMLYMTALKPGYIRVGGTLADRLKFDPENKQSSNITRVNDELLKSDYITSIKPNFTLSGENWLTLNKLANKTGFVILFDLNALIRHKNGSWDSRNAEDLIKYSNDNNLTVIWQLGNEPNSFKHVFNYEVNATQLADDFNHLRTILKKYPNYKDSLLVGPDVTRPRPENPQSERFLKEFLEFGVDIDVVSWHQYYFNGRTATFYDFINPEIFNLFESQIITVKEIVNSANISSDKPIWLTETASAYGGGAPGYSNRYLGTFIWLDKLGLAAKHSLKVVVRQSICKGYYALLSEDYEPTPDWWISVLYKEIVGPEVIPCKILAPPRVRIYCHCTRKNFTNEAITIFGINMQNVEARIRIEGVMGMNENSFVFTYIFSPYFSLHSKYIRLNGDLLKANKNVKPQFKPILLNPHPYLIIPPFSTAFWVMPTDKVKACSSNV